MKESKKYVKEVLAVIQEAVGDIATIKPKEDFTERSRNEISVSFGISGTATVTARQQQHRAFSGVSDVSFSVNPVIGADHRTALRARTFKPRKTGAWNVEGLRSALLNAAKMQLKVVEQKKALVKNIKAARELEKQILNACPWGKGLVDADGRAGNVTISIVTTSFHAARDVLNAFYCHLDPKDLKPGAGKKTS